MAEIDAMTRETNGRTNSVHYFVRGLSAEVSGVYRYHSLDASVRLTLLSSCSNQMVFAENQ